MPQMTVTSSAIQGVGYSYPHRRLAIQFRDGTTYIYMEVPRSVWDRFRRTQRRPENGFLPPDQAGKFFNARVRNRFPFQRLDGLETVAP